MTRLPIWRIPSGPDREYSLLLDLADRFGGRLAGRPWDHGMAYLEFETSDHSWVMAIGHDQAECVRLLVPHVSRLLLPRYEELVRDHA